jgi:hypothetical protein
VRSASVVMVSPLLDSYLEMAFVERDHEIQTLSAQCAAKSLACGSGSEGHSAEHRYRTLDTPEALIFRTFSLFS